MSPSNALTGFTFNSLKLSPALVLILDACVVTPRSACRCLSIAFSVRAASNIVPTTGCAFYDIFRLVLSGPIYH